MTGAADWQGRVGATWSAEWRRTDRAFAGIGASLVDAAAALRPDAQQVLDVGCGAGATSLVLAERLADAQLLGLDISPDLVDVARDRASGQSRCRFAVGDAADWADSTRTPDLIVSRHGVMFFADPTAAFTHLRQCASDGAGLAFTCFRSRDDNSWTSDFLDLLDNPPPPPLWVPGPYAFADADAVAMMLAEAGWRDAVMIPLDVDFVTGSGTDPVADAVAFHSRIGSTASALAAADAIERQRLLEGIAQIAEAHLVDGEVRFGAAIWQWTASA